MGLSCDAAAQAIRAVKCDSVTFFIVSLLKRRGVQRNKHLEGRLNNRLQNSLVTERVTAMSKKDLDYVLEEVVGGGGRWQWRKWLFLVPTYLAMGAPALLMQMFSAYTPTHR